MLQCTELESLSRDKYSSLFGSFVAYEENEVLWIQLLVSISPIFYEQIFCTKVFCAAFICLQFKFVIFWQKDFGAKAVNKLLVKLTPGAIAYYTYQLSSLLQKRVK